MPAIHVIGVDRPLLATQLAARGLRVADCADEAAARFACAPGASPTLVEASDPLAAAAWLDAGADDVVLRCDPDALVAARLAALVRRDDAVVTIGALRIDPRARAASRGARRLILRPREYALLLHLARNPGQVVGREALRRAVLGIDFDPGTNGLAVHVSRLRAELDRDGPPMLATERGAGYRLVAQGE